MAILQLNSAVEKTRATRPSSDVSQALRAIRDDLDREPDGWDVRDCPEESATYRIRVASNRALREHAYRLAYRVYSRCGFVSAQRENWCVSPFDNDPQTLTLLIEDQRGADVATVSLVFDSAAGLPCDEIYHAELDALRSKGHRLVEVTRLVMDCSQARSKFLLMRLFNFIYVFARRVRGFSDFVIEVNPHHVGYYRRLLMFEQIGPEQPCPRVQGAPAVLLRLNLALAESEIERRHEPGSTRSEPRTVYDYMYGPAEESAAAEFLAQRHQPMSIEDAKYFNLIKPNVSAIIPLAAAGA